ncbi:MAG: hypothetical protein PHW00_05680, partial [Clostridia bacterium]|nr:hypothetical protein [Clostridia bacterium]
MDKNKKAQLWQMLKFVLFSISAGVIQAVSFTLLNELVNWGPKFVATEYGPNYFIALVLSVLWNFTFNRKFTFKSANNIPIAMLKIFAYYCVFTPLSIWWGVALTKAVTWRGFEYIVLLGTMIVNMLTEYLVCKFWVYRNSENTNDLAKRQQLDTIQPDSTNTQDTQQNNLPNAQVTQSNNSTDAQQDNISS